MDFMIQHFRLIITVTRTFETLHTVWPDRLSLDSPNMETNIWLWIWIARNLGTNYYRYDY